LRFYLALLSYAGTCKYSLKVLKLFNLVYYSVRRLFTKAKLGSILNWKMGKIESSYLNGG
jgi:hypothetical protein